MISIYSLIWTFINCGLMALLILFLRTRKNFLARYGTFSLVVLFFCCIIRMFIPVEFPEHQFIIHNTSIYNHLLNPFFTISFPEWTLYFVLGIWFLGSVIVCLRLFWQTATVERELITNCLPADPRTIAILRELDPSGKVEIKISPNIIVAILTGFFHPIIYLPDVNYSDEELHYILLHEYTHYVRKDIWKKLFFNVLYAIFWWNPFVYILKQEASELIEFLCDRQLGKQLSEREVVAYLQILRDNVARMQNSTVDQSLKAIGFAKSSKNKNDPTWQRFRLLLQRTKKSRTGVVPKIVVVGIAAVWMVCSYYFILQANYTAPSNEIWSDSTTLISNESNSYLEEQEDSSYLFYYEGSTTPIPVTKEDVDAGLYAPYPIKPYKREINWISKFFSIFN